MKPIAGSRDRRAPPSGVAYPCGGGGSFGPTLPDSFRVTSVVEKNG